MTLQSMTGFARVEGNNQAAHWAWEVRSVNGKGLDFRLRTPPGFDNLQPQIREMVTGHLSRGNLQITLTIDRQKNAAVPIVNQEALDAVIAAIASLQEKLNCPTPAAEQILAIRGVMEMGDNFVAIWLKFLGSRRVSTGLYIFKYLLNGNQEGVATLHLAQR